MRISTVLVLIFSANIVFAAKDPFAEAKEDYLRGDVSDAIESLSDIKDEKLSEKDRGFKYFALGLWSREMQKWADAEAHLNHAFSFNPDIKSHLHYELGVLYRQNNKLEKAEQEFLKAREHKPPRNITLSSKFYLSDLYMRKGQWNKAYAELNYLRRRWRGAEQYPEVLWRLVKVEMKKKRKWRACRWARKLYSRYPSHPLVHDWPIELHRARFDGAKLGCLASKKDIASRIRRLQWGGASDRARSELNDIKKITKGAPNYQTDSMLAEFLINEGYVDEALKLLLQYHKDEQNNFDYLMLLGKAASRAGEFQTSIGAYYKAYKIHPNRRDGRRALFRAAFISYQFQDYDGAGRKFEEFVKKYRRSGLSRDSMWYLAWIKYLKGDYAGAISGLQDMLDKKKRHPRRWGKYSTEKITYWLAMSHLRSENVSEAKLLFDSLTQTGLRPYYTFAAIERLKTLPAVRDYENYQQIQRSLSSVEIENETPVDGLGQQATEENETEESIALTEEQESEEDIDLAENQEKVEDEKPIAFKDPKLNTHFDRSQNFVRLGLFNMAKWELWEIERRTTNKEYLSLLMQSYEKIGSYHRSAYIGEVHFQQPRKKHGIEGVKYLWQHTYPQAYKLQVQKFADRFNVPESFIWSIMRAESRFRYDIKSPVGATGLMQLMPHTGRQVARLLREKSFHPKNLTDPETNIRLGSRYLQRLLKKFDASMPLAAAGYNAGPHRVESWLSAFGELDMDEFIEHIPFIETRKYVKKVSAYYGVYSQVYDGKIPKLSWITQSVPVKMTRKPASRETWELIQ